MLPHRFPVGGADCQDCAVRQLHRLVGVAEDIFPVYDIGLVYYDKVFGQGFGCLFQPAVEFERRFGGHDPDFASLAFQVDDVPHGEVIMLLSPLEFEALFLSPDEFQGRFHGIAYLLLRDGLHQEIQGLGLEELAGVGGLAGDVDDLHPRVVQVPADIMA